MGPLNKILELIHTGIETKDILVCAIVLCKTGINLPAHNIDNLGTQGFKCRGLHPLRIYKASRGISLPTRVRRSAKRVYLSVYRKRLNDVRTRV